MTSQDGRELVTPRGETVAYDAFEHTLAGMVDRGQDVDAWRVH